MVTFLLCVLLMASIAANVVLGKRYWACKEQGIDDSINVKALTKTHDEFKAIVYGGHFKP